MNRVYAMAVELLNNEAYDIQEDYSNEEIAEVTKDIIAKLNTGSDVVQAELYGNLIKVRNGKHGSFVSFSTGEYTGLSESKASIRDLTKYADADEIKNLIEMINEAYYQAVA